MQSRKEQAPGRAVRKAGSTTRSVTCAVCGSASLSRVDSAMRLQQCCRTPITQGGVSITVPHQLVIRVWVALLALQTYHTVRSESGAQLCDPTTRKKRGGKILHSSPAWGHLRAKV